MMSDDGSIVTKEKVEKYLALTAEARAKATPIAASEEDIARLDSMMRMCDDYQACLLYTSPSPRDQRGSRMPSSA